MVETRAPAATLTQAEQATSSVPDDLVEIARVSGAHGIRGWIKIQPFSDDSAALETVKRWWLTAPSRALDKVLTEQEAMPSRQLPESAFRRVDVAWTKVHGSTWLACVRGLFDRDEAQALKSHSIWVSRKDFPALEEDEFYWIDLVGCEVVSADSDSTSESDSGMVRLGIVDSVEDNPAHPLLSVLRQEQGQDGQWTASLNARQKPVLTLIPFVAAHVIDVDLKQRRIVVDWSADF